MIRFRIDTERMTFGDWVAVTSEDTDSREIRDLMVRFVVGEDGEYLPEREARREINKVPLKQQKALLFDPFSAAWKSAEKKAVPPATSASS